jgi:DtxR family Mn-dependent transcriptional regulator
MNDNQEYHTVRGYEILGKQQEVLSPSMEDYLEMIYRNSKEEGYVRINSLAEALNVQAPSVTKMVQKLGKSGLLHYERYGIVRLTPEGERIGAFLLKRHEIIERFLKIVGVKEKLLVNVELIEHNVTDGALEKIEVLNNFFDENPDVLKEFERYKVLRENKNKPL